ncbi:MAG: hypothetical protein V1684_00635 [bacterium]
MKRDIIKIKNLNCQVGYLTDPEGMEEIYCHGNDDCGSCCGLGGCECAANN